MSRGWGNVAQLIECLPGINEALGPSQVLHKLGAVEHISNPSIHLEGGELTFRGILCYIVNLRLAWAT